MTRDRSLVKPSASECPVLLIRQIHLHALLAEADEAPEDCRRASQQMSAMRTYLGRAVVSGWASESARQGGEMPELEAQTTCPSLLCRTTMKSNLYVSKLS